MIRGEVLDALIACGATAEMIVAAVKADAAADDARRAAKRESNAERQRRFKAKRKPSNAANALPGVINAPAETPPNDIYSNPPVPPVEAKASTAPKGRSDRGSKISESWEAPSIAELTPEAKALAERWPAAAYRAEAEAFRNYWLGESSAKARKSDWNRAWSNRIVAVNGKVMRDAKFSGAINLVGKASSAPMNAGQLRSAIAFAEDNGDPERAAELRREMTRLTARDPPKLDLVRGVAAKLSVGIHSKGHTGRGG